MNLGVMMSENGEISGAGLEHTRPMEIDHDACYRALSTRDARFDGRFFMAVRTTRIYCRPICPARTPKRENVTFFTTASAAQEAGYRPCLRCRPESSPDLGASRGTSNTVSRTLTLVGEGALDALEQTPTPALRTMSMPTLMAPQILYADRLETTIGTLLLIHDREGHLRALDFHDFEPRMRRLLRLHYGAEGDDFAMEDREAPPEIRRAINNYFLGDLLAIDTVSVATGGTSFQREVWAALRTIQAGTTVSYGALARQLGRPRSVRAVGLANGANPIAIIVPCHRVIGADGSLTGYGGGISRKRWLLIHEGVALEKSATRQIPEAA